MLEAMLAWLTMATPYILAGLGVIGLILILSRWIVNFNKTPKNASGG